MPAREPTDREIDDAKRRFKKADPGMAGLMDILDAPEDFRIAFLQTHGYIEKPAKPAPWYRRLTWLRYAWRAARQRRG